MDRIMSGLPYIITGGIFVILAAVMVIKRIRKKKREKEFEIEDSGTDEDDSEY